MDNTISEEEKKKIKESILYALFENEEVKQAVKDNVPDVLKPYAHINPYSPDSDKQINFVNSVLHPNIEQRQPKWVQLLIDKGLVEVDGVTVIAKSLGVVATEIADNNITVTNVMLQRFINGKTKKNYSKRSIDAAIEIANAN